jgi:REP element-mobilizing transposase RayT
MDRDRRSIRLRDFDYGAAGAYFVTLCTVDRACLFGTITGGEMCLNTLGALVEAAWQDTPRLRPNIALDACVVMPNHLHGIVIIETETDAGAGGGVQLRSPARTIGAVVRGFKAATTRQADTPLWQRNYYEHVIRDDRDLDRIRQYIANNPAAWDHDGETRSCRRADRAWVTPQGLPSCAGCGTSGVGRA